MKTSKIAMSRPMLSIGTLLIALGLPHVLSAAGYPEEGSSAKGATSWAQNCARCHNMRDPQDLRDDQWVTSVFHMRTRAGLTGQQTRDILTFLQESNNAAAPVAARSMAATTSSAPATRSGEEIYLQSCVACHGANGKGTVPGAPDLTRADGSLAQTDDVLIRNITDGFQSPGSPMAMPPRGGNSALTEADIRAVLRYMQERFRP